MNPVVSLICKALPHHNQPARELVRRSMLEFGIEAEFDGLDRAIGALGTECSSNVVELVAESDGVLCACLAVADVGEGAAKLFGFYVDPALRGNGLGRRLLQDAIAETVKLGFARLDLDTWGSMQAAIRLYESFGWVRVDDPPPESGAERSYALDLQRSRQLVG